MPVTCYIEKLLCFGVKKGLLEDADVIFARNQLLDIMGLDAAGEAAEFDELPETATSILEPLINDAVARGLTGDTQTERDLFDTRLMGALMPRPSQIRRTFDDLMKTEGAKAATDWFYDICRSSNYIRVDQVARNIAWDHESSYGKLTVTINLSKPEKDPKEIAKLKNAPSVGYPKCMLCVENPGYRGRSNFPARQNHRVVPVKLSGQDWYVQYSPYAYYEEHCIVFNSQHVPMKISRGTFERLFDFVRQLPHYMLGSNADLPIVGGSILNHDHFQGGRYSFPMDKAPVKAVLSSPNPAVEAVILDWPMSALQLRGTDEAALIDEAEHILNAWRGWTDAACDVFAETDGTPHNTITPILRKVDGRYLLTLVMRNNRTSEEHPLGIFHPHAPLHHIKKENIGLIEVMGLFILPGRLKTELAALQDFLTGKREMIRPDESDMSAKHYDWVEEIVRVHGLCNSDAEAEALLRSEVAKVCAQVLADAGVYKQDDNGLNGFKRFMNSVGYQG